MRNKILLVLAAAAASLGCTDGGGKGLSISATGSTAAADTNTAASGNAIDAGHGILITRIRVVVASAEVEGFPACPNVIAPPIVIPTLPVPGAPPVTPPRSDGQPVSAGVGMACMEGSEDLSDDDGECEIAGGPYLVDLAGAALTGGTRFVVGLEVPAGTYDEVEFKIRTIDATRAGTSEGLEAMASAHASILADGTMDGAAFAFSTPMALKQEREGPIVVDPKTGANVTLDFDASGWFKAADGGKLDPTDPADRGQILANIRGSIRVVSDDDRDGREDGHHHGGGHHGGWHDVPWVPCGGKACGARCQLCAPHDTQCAETAVLKVCDPAGACVGEGTPFTCPALPNPCAGLTCGSECTISLPCHLATPPCLAPQWLGHCDLSGRCLPGAAGSCQPSADCAAKACGDACNPCGPDRACPTFMATACDPWGRCVSALPGLCACSGKACGAACDPCDGLCTHPYASTCDGTGHCRPVGRGVTCSP